MLDQGCDMYMHTHMHVAYSPAASQFARFIASRHVGPNAERARVRKRVTGCGLGLYAFVTLRWAVTVWLVVWPVLFGFLHFVQELAYVECLKKTSF